MVRIQARWLSIVRGRISTGFAKSLSSSENDGSKCGMARQGEYLDGDQFGVLGHRQKEAGGDTFVPRPLLLICLQKGICPRHASHCGDL
jgi:hypothetical protein